MTLTPQTLLKSMTWRCIGPPRGGRVVAVAGDPHRPNVFYFGAVAGGVWKTTDAGVTWTNISDGYFKSASVGAIAVADADPNVIYVGMGETTIRTDVSHGDGVYKSTDGGQSWQHLGLAETRHIGKIRIHPQNPDIAYVAALGHAFGPNPERGVYRTKDGGKTWDLVLHRSDKAGAVDLSFDPHHPAVVYATMWEAQRNFWSLSSGGEESGLWKSSDGGDTWSEITRAKGLPQSGLIGKIGVAASPAKTGRVWALIESQEAPGLYRSDDYGATWQKLTDKQDLRYRPWYYSHVIADPVDADTLFVMNLGAWKSTDGGKTFEQIPTPHGDNHDLWIDPHNNQRMVQGNDGGACVSFNGGETFSTIYNQLTAQFYNIAADNQQPYRVYATQQDNSSISVPSDTPEGVITWGDCYAAGTGESGFIAVHPDDPNIVYVGAVGSSPGGGGALQRYDHRTRHIQLINVWPEPHGGIGPKELKYRFPWTFPILFSPHDSNVLYTTGNVVFRSTNEGMSWTPISPDLTRNDPSKLEPSGGPITKDTSGAEHYCTIATLRESPHEPGVLWSGSDDGLVYLSQDGGQNWVNVTPPDLPEWSFVRTVEPSPHDPATLYLAATRYKLDDPAPYLYKTTDYGETWTKIVAGIPADDYTRVIRADPAQPGLLYAGTETGVYVSLDDGASWQRWEANLPVTPVYDLLVKENDLIAGTHGRSFWITDDLTLLRSYAQAAPDADKVQLFAPHASQRILPDLFSAYFPADEGKSYGVGLGKAITAVNKKNDDGFLEMQVLDGGQGRTRGVVIRYWLPTAPDADTVLSLGFYDADNKLVRSFVPKPAGYDKLDEKQKGLNPGPWMPARQGVNRFVWDMRHEGAVKVAGNKTAGEADRGPLALPGEYTVRLTVGDETASQSFAIVNDPRVQTPLADLQAQFALLQQIYGKISDCHRGINLLRDVMAQAKGWAERLGKRENSQSIAEAAQALVKKLEAIEDVLILPGEQADTFGLNVRVRLNAKLASLIPIVGSADRAPTRQAGELFAVYAAQADDQLAQLQALLDGEVEALNSLIQETNLPAILV
ncbi:MAG: glycoside hydrolase [Caldilineaceae bacterium]|nr:glycoside hydrolase [Caldilineaceae bacterium]